MTQEERILAALRSNPMTLEHLSEALMIHRTVLVVSWLRPLMGEGLIVQMPDGRFVREEELEQFAAEVANG